ncbi:MAG: M48 family metallopeptidase [Cyanothece sp. SIO1E1]|nr:M48 family metallopeptidase [Cyanothece sp. SIO1E1]
MNSLKAFARPYQVRESNRAKHVSIKVSYLGEVEIVVPRGFNRQQLPEILHKRQAWIEKTISRIQAERRSMPAEPADTLPEQLALRALPEDWTVAYSQGAGAQIAATVTHQHALMAGDTTIGFK